jgi:LysR family transcriptional regulator, hydrogen peroxide-inducible genes activator
MEMHQLRYFRAVAEHRSFTQAARREHVSQPSLSHQIMKLEDELGAKLFNRKGHVVDLTSYGAAFLPKIESILQQLQDAKSQILEMAKVEKGKVTLGVIPTITPFLLPNVLASFLHQHPLIELNVKEECSGVLLKALRESTIDLALMPLPVNSDDVSCIELMRERLFAIVWDKHPLQNEKQIKLEQLSGAPFLMLKDGHCFRDDALSAFHAANVEPRIIFESGCFLTILNMVRAGIGISVMPEMAVDPTSGCRFIPIEGEHPIRTIGLVQRKQQYQTHVQLLLASFLRAQLLPSDTTGHNMPRLTKDKTSRMSSIEGSSDRRPRQRPTPTQRTSLADRRG